MGRSIVIPREFRQPIVTRPNFDGNAFPKRAQLKASFNKTESEIDQKGNPKRGPNRSKMCKGGAQRALNKQVAIKTLATRKQTCNCLAKLRIVEDVGSQLGPRWILKRSPNRACSSKFNIKSKKRCQGAQEGVLNKHDFRMDL